MVLYITDNNLLTTFQSGYRHHHSTTSVALKVTNDVESGFEDKKSTILVLLDFSKAFDSISHSILCNKLRHNFDFACSSTNLLHSYLTGRKQCVKIGDAKSDYLDIYSGVPQGSVLGPLLFSLYINDLVSVLHHSTPHLYADDLQIYASAKVESVNECVDGLNSDLQAISVWADQNKLSLNVLKSQAICFRHSLLNSILPLPPIYLDNTVIPYADSVRNLGFIMSENLSWSKQVGSICSKVYATLRRLRSVTQFLPLNMRRKMILALCIPHFIYCDVVFWTSLDSSCKHKLALCFNACTRYIHSLKKFDHISRFSKSILGCELSTYYSYRSSLFLKKVVLTQQPIYIFERLLFGGSARTKNIIIPTHSSSYLNRSFAVRGAVAWNALPAAAKHTPSLGKFKVMVKNHLQFQAADFD